MDKQWHADRSFSMLTPTFRMENEEPRFKDYNYKIIKTRLKFSISRVKGQTDKIEKIEKMDKTGHNGQSWTKWSQDKN